MYRIIGTFILLVMRLEEGIVNASELADGDHGWRFVFLGGRGYILENCARGATEAGSATDSRGLFFCFLFVLIGESQAALVRNVDLREEADVLGQTLEVELGAVALVGRAVRSDEELQSQQQQQQKVSSTTQVS